MGRITLYAVSKRQPQYRRQQSDGNGEHHGGPRLHLLPPLHYPPRLAEWGLQATICPVVGGRVG